MISGVDREGNLRFAAFTGIARRLGSSHENSCCGQSNYGVDKKRLRELQAESALRREKHLKLSIGSGQKLGRASSSSSSTLTTTTTNILRSGIPESSPLLKISSTSSSTSSPSPSMSSFKQSTTISFPSSQSSNTKENNNNSNNNNNNESRDRYWSCSQCTYLNSIIHFQCEMCHTSKNQSISPSTLIPTHSPQLPPPRNRSLEVINLEEEENDNQIQNNNNIESIIQNPSYFRNMKSSSNAIDLGKEVEDDETICLWVCSICFHSNKINIKSCRICGSCN